jgi:hypothetical protein
VCRVGLGARLEERVGRAGVAGGGGVAPDTASAGDMGRGLF